MVEAPVWEREKKVRKRGRRVAHADAVIPIPVSQVDHYNAVSIDCEIAQVCIVVRVD